MKGVSDNPGVSLGQIIKVTGQGITPGSFRITKVTHTATENGTYLNSFEGIDAAADTYPMTNVMAYPKSNSQVAVVMDNADPDGLGRIKVQFPWQKPQGEVTPWLRVMTPHAGGEKGFHFIPETGEEVLIGFEGGNAERPYVMGALYNGSSNPAGWKTGTNDVKAIRTRSGHTIELNDTKGGEFITITDQSGNKILLDTKGSNISITAPGNLSLMADTIDIKAKNGITMQSEEASIAIDAKQDVGMHSKEAKVQISGKQDVDMRSHDATVKLKAKTTANIVGNDKVDILSGNELAMHGKSTSKLTGGEVHVNKG
ncbi:hypothetical protein GCM10009117_25690 [Gangjinia marincola]|uniref:Gp5/Type VI secretion system Vgr protein OB-fold domain-containing protein n=1 Tax=Gangjinia marincola TaxID=578463 RepID=A0ABN1MKH8_9FLAO